ncbi:MAG: hypothetical protein QW350_01610 [Candidatus Aenigmatarchaeota archaeon]|nr:hypothetical protein [Candidatus Aenigmarchaeota archaeon]
MGMELEYPFKFILYLIVIIVLVGIMISIKEKILKTCFFPPCEEKKSCEFETENFQEINLNENIISKYCNLCFEKSKECKRDKLCYIISLENSFDFSRKEININEDKCKITCEKNTNLIYFSYIYFEDKIKVGC